MSNELAYMVDIPTKIIPLNLLDHIPDNTNEMTDAQFNMLCHGIEETKRVPPLLVAPKGNGRYVIMDGNHRFRAVTILGWPAVNCNVWEDITEGDAQAIISARVNLLRGQPNKANTTKIWLRLTSSMDERAAMRILGIPSDSRLRQVIHTAKRRMDTATIAKDEVQRMLSRTRHVEDLANIIRAVMGDLDGTGEFDYLAFQVRGSQILLARCDKEQYEDLKVRIGHIDRSGADITQTVIDALRAHVGDDAFVADEEE